ncbi:MAG: glycosyltransferase family 39 protein, partial [Acidobacteria bacterium]|nr:glycosyltransferase family 39 protein [Acidobacteriota bacterium]
MLLSSVWLLGLPGDWLLDDFSLLGMEFPSLLRPRFLSYFTFWLNFEWFGPVPWAFRLTNILLHAVAVQFCYRALRRLLGDGRALFAAAVFAVNPLQADAVLYVFSRPVVLMGLLVWVALERWLAGKHWWAVLFYALALLAKEEAIAFPLFLMAVHFSISRNSREWRPIGVMFGLALVALGGVVYAT